MFHFSSPLTVRLCVVEHYFHSPLFQRWGWRHPLFYVYLFHKNRIDEIPVVDEEGVAVGLIDVQDVIALKLVD